MGPLIRLGRVILLLLRIIRLLLLKNTKGGLSNRFQDGLQHHDGDDFLATGSVNRRLLTGFSA
jgi:hypothetical protein